MNVSSEQRNTKALELLPFLKSELGTQAIGVSDRNLLKFLRWKPDVSRAAGRFRAHLRWRRRNAFAFDGSPLLRASEDPELRRLLESEVLAAPEGLVDKNGSPVLVFRWKNNDMSDGRACKNFFRTDLYMIDRILERESAQLNGITVFHDMRGMSFKNIHPALIRFVSAIIGNFPIRIKAIYIIGPPPFLLPFFKVFLLVMPSKIHKRIHIISDMSEIYKVIDQDRLLQEHGGMSQHNTLQWVADQIQREVNGTMESLKDCITTTSCFRGPAFNSA